MHYVEPQIEIMDSSVSEIVLVPSGLRPSGKSTISAASESIISTRDTQCMAYLYNIWDIYIVAIMLSMHQIPLKVLNSNFKYMSPLTFDTITFCAFAYSAV